MNRVFDMLQLVDKVGKLEAASKNAKRFVSLLTQVALEVAIFLDTS